MRILDISSRGAILQRTIFTLTKDSGCRFTPALRPHTRPEMAFRKFLPLFDRVLVERFTAETVTKGGIMLPEKSQGKVLQATVVAVGPGSVTQDFYNWPDESFEEMDSTLAVQQYIQQNIRSDCSNIDKILEPPEGQDEGVWKYEHLRQFCLELNGLAVKLQSECHPDTCTQMTATEQWIFLCAAHKTPKECPAIDYTRHTLDGAACLLNSNKYFPSRVSIKESSVAKLGSVCRRIYRIFSHAYFHHRQIFDKYENETFLCHRFTRFVMKYNLMSKDNLIVPILEEEVQNTSSAGESEA
ncbi:MOB-like protein phocein isoform X3 [Astatotilapia calliptera]|uniref:MOB-like protein phocein isoform X3 n=1 Tax=Maylandia zebra TaxID=106582 RepID=UPI000329EA6E|nr:MOB-like protein phocein isoform X3 [Maylandia zebra]XP_025999478.1 MOB-like protein phocein isoform X3 [Astatotilapia calliptera]